MDRDDDEFDIEELRELNHIYGVPLSVLARIHKRSPRRMSRIFKERGWFVVSRRNTTTLIKEMKLIHRLIKEYGVNTSQMARLLGCDPKTVRTKLAQYEGQVQASRLPFVRTPEKKRRIIRQILKGEKVRKADIAYLAGLSSPTISVIEQQMWEEEDKHGES